MEPELVGLSEKLQPRKINKPGREIQRLEYAIPIPAAATPEPRKMV